MTLPAPHTATINVDGATDPMHPDPDHEDCGFEAYLASNWASSPPFLVGPWLFYWMDGYWNSTPATGG